MSEEKSFDFPGADVILRVLGPPARDFRAHKLLLSLASPVFKDMFFPSRPITPTPGQFAMSSVAELDIVPVTDPPHALDAVLRVIYPVPSPPLDRNLDTIVQCLIVADKYKIEAAMSRLRNVLSRIPLTNGFKAIRIYGIASRFEFTELADNISRQISSVNIAGISGFPDDFEFIPAATYQKLVRQRACYLEAVTDGIRQAPVKPMCSDCPGGPLAEEVFKLRLSQLVMRGTALEAKACFEAWVKAYGRNAACKEDCVTKFIRFTVAKVEALPGVPKLTLKA